MREPYPRGLKLRPGKSLLNQGAFARTLSTGIETEQCTEPHERGEVPVHARTLSTGIETRRQGHHQCCPNAREPYPRGLKQVIFKGPGDLPKEVVREPYPRGLKLPLGSSTKMRFPARTLSTGIETRWNGRAGNTALRANLIHGD